MFSIIAKAHANKLLFQELNRALQSKDMKIRSKQCFNTSITLSNLPKEKASLLGQIKQLKNAIIDKGAAKAEQASTVHALKNELRKWRVDNKKLKRAMESKDKKLGRLQSKIASLEQNTEA